MSRNLVKHFFARNFVSTASRMSSSYTPRRALIYVPASNEKMLQKIPSISADCVVLECEDGVAMTSKDIARENVVKFLESPPVDRKCIELGLRINSVSSGLISEDLRALGAAKNLPEALMVPKIDSIQDLQEFWRLFNENFPQDRMQKQSSSMKLVIWIESARGLLSMPEILTAAKNLPIPNLSLDACVFGSDDYCADIGATRSKQGEETMFARQRFVACCKAFGLQAIDSVYIDIKDLDGLKSQCGQGQAWGFTGKQVIHPSQLPIVQSTFLPSPERIEWAEELISNYTEHEQSGKGAFTFRGQMIDRPLLKQAENIVELLSRIKSNS